MDNTNTNIAVPEGPKKINKILLFIFISILVITAVLSSYYLYTQYKIGKNNKTSAPEVYANWLTPASVGQPYKGTVLVVVYNQNVQISGKIESGLPPGLQLTTCQTDHNTSTTSEIPTKNSYGKCVIEGTPQQSGSFTVRAHFSFQDGDGEIIKDLPLVVNP
jgi:hypothetical protein